MWFTEVHVPRFQVNDDPDESPVFVKSPQQWYVCCERARITRIVCSYDQSCFFKFCDGFVNILYFTGTIYCDRRLSATPHANNISNLQAMCE
jgi:hypothetical protein